MNTENLNAGGVAEHLPRVRALLRACAMYSDDPDTQTACFVARGEDILIAAANEVPAGVERKPERLTRPAKYRFIGHAERVLIARAARSGISLAGSTMCLNWFPCAECALSIAEAGIAVLVCDRAAYESRKDDSRYGFVEANEILSEAGVRVEWM
jgi:dCMP deaminase